MVAGDDVTPSLTGSGDADFSLSASFLTLLKEAKLDGLATNAGKAACLADTDCLASSTLTPRMAGDDMTTLGEMRALHVWDGKVLGVAAEGVEVLLLARGHSGAARR